MSLNAVLALESRSDLECTICLELLCEPLSLPCQHVFCRSCLIAAIQTGRNCPLCRADIPLRFNPTLAPVQKSVEKTLIRCCTVEYEARLEDLAAAAAKLIRLKISNGFQFLGLRAGKLTYEWTVQVELEAQPDEASALPEDAALPDIVEKVRFGLLPACRVMSCSSREMGPDVSTRKAPSYVEAACAPFEVRATSWTAFSVPIVIFFKEWLGRAPLRLEHSLDFQTEGGSWSYGVDLADAFARELHVANQDHTVAGHQAAPSTPLVPARGEAVPAPWGSAACPSTASSAAAQPGCCSSQPQTLARGGPVARLSAWMGSLRSGHR